MKVKALALLASGITLCGITQCVLADGVKIISLSRPDSFYVGVDAGGADFMNKESHSVSPESHQLGAFGLVGGAYAGYEFGIKNNFRAAAEIFFDVTGLQTKIVHNNNTYKMYQYYNTGIRLLPAYAFTPVSSMHLIVGYANGRFNINDNGVYGTISTSYNTGGYQLGAGFDTQLEEHFYVRLDALYNAYNSKTKQGAGLTGLGSVQYYTNRFSQLAAEVSVYYRFAC